MSKLIFLFDLDSTITRKEILPTAAKEVGIYDQISSLTESTMRGEIPFKQSFLHRVELFKSFPVSKIRKIIADIELNEPLVKFIKENKERCYIVTGNLDVWIEDLIKRLGMKKNTFCSKALVQNDYIADVFSVVDKYAVIKQVVLPFVAVGDGSNDAEMIEAAEIGIGYGGVREIASPIMACASHAIYDEKKLVEFLRRLV